MLTHRFFVPLLQVLQVADVLSYLTLQQLTQQLGGLRHSTSQNGAAQHGAAQHDATNNSEHQGFNAATTANQPLG